MTNRYKRLLGIATCCIAACTGPAPVPEVPVPPLAQATLAEQTSYPWPRSEWWQDMHDSQLSTLMSTALRDNPNLQVAAARIDQAQGLALMAGANFKPMLGAEAVIGAARFSNDFVQSRLAGKNFGVLSVSPLTLRYHLDFWGRDRALLAAALGTEQAANAEYAQARILLSTALARAYVRLGIALDRLHVAQDLVAVQTRLQALVATRRRSGLDPRQAALNVEQGLALAQQRLLTDQTEIRIARNQIAALAGQAPAWAAQFSANRLELAGRLPLPERLPLSLLGHRADVSAARWRAEAAAQDVKIAHTQFYPDVNLIGFAGLQTVNLTDLLFMGKHAAFAIGPSLVMPLFMGGQLEGNLSQKEAVYHAAVATYNNSLLRALQDTADALTRWQDSRQRLLQQTEATNAALQQVTLVNSLHRAGLVHQGQILESRYRAAEQRYLLSSMTAEQDVAAIGLIEALGGGYTTTAPTP
jgi:NodT family efflux transporter outer membrane factor (OMF) lipoprotein